VISRDITVNHGPGGLTCTEHLRSLTRTRSACIPSFIHLTIRWQRASHLQTPLLPRRTSRYHRWLQLYLHMEYPVYN
jgi:hypothetical protein